MAVTFKDFQQISWRYQALIVVGVVVALLWLFSIQFLGPIQEEVDAKQAQLDQLTVLVAQARVRQQQLEEIKAETRQLQDRLDSLKAILPLERETASILRQVQQAATDSSMTILRVTPRAIVEREVYSEWPIEMQVQATYHNMGLFLDRIRRLPRIVNISGLVLAASGDGLTTSVAATYTATTFVYREEEPLPPEPESTTGD